MVGPTKAAIPHMVLAAGGSSGLQMEDLISEGLERDDWTHEIQRHIDLLTFSWWVACIMQYCNAWLHDAVLVFECSRIRAC